VYHLAEWLEGPHGALRTTDRSAWLVSASRRPRRLRVRRGPQPEQVLLDALLGATDAREMGARDALATVAMVEAAIRSLALERRVRVDELYSGAAVVR
jgi:hypothetical protein